MDDGSCIYCISTDSTTFNYTGAVQTYVVPSNINSVTIGWAEGGGRLLAYSGLGEIRLFSRRVAVTWRYFEYICWWSWIDKFSLEVGMEEGQLHLVMVVVVHQMYD